uniref:Ig-like domain-containing protein n=1 Tax=Callorhinchus milii TaxID=7868 RepID=A0A4W3GW69_CALMI
MLRFLGSLSCAIFLTQFFFLTSVGTNHSLPLQSGFRSEPESGTSGIQTLTCVAAGFLPRDLNVSWMVTGDVPHETESASLTVNSDGTFTLSSRLSLQTPDWHLGSAVTCQVQHITLIPPGTERISFTPSKSFCNKEWDIRIEKGANCSKRVK